VDDARGVPVARARRQSRPTRLTAQRSQEPGHASRAENRFPGQLPDVWNVTPSQPQYDRMSRVHPRACGAHVPGASAPQPCPSHVPDAQSAASRHDAPSALRSPLGGAEGSDGTDGAGAGVGLDGGGFPGAEQPATIATSRSRWNISGRYVDYVASAARDRDFLPSPRADDDSGHHFFFGNSSTKNAFIAAHERASATGSYAQPLLASVPAPWSVKQCTAPPYSTSCQSTFASASSL